MTVAKLKPAGCCSTFAATSAKGLFWFTHQMKTTVLDTLKKAAFFSARFFMQLGHYLARGAVFLKDAAVVGFKNMKAFTAQHPKEVKIAAVALGVGVALTALISHLCHHAPPLSKVQSQVH